MTYYYPRFARLLTWLGLCAVFLSHHVRAEEEEVDFRKKTWARILSE